MESPPLVCFVQHFSLLAGRAWAMSQGSSHQHHAGNLAPSSSGVERVPPLGESSASRSPSKAALQAELPSSGELQVHLCHAVPASHKPCCAWRKLPWQQSPNGPRDGQHHAEVGVTASLLPALEVRTSGTEGRAFPALRASLKQGQELTPGPQARQCPPSSSAPSVEEARSQQCWSDTTTRSSPRYVMAVPLAVPEGVTSREPAQTGPASPSSQCHQVLPCLWLMVGWEQCCARGAAGATPQRGRHQSHHPQLHMGLLPTPHGRGRCRNNPSPPLQSISVLHLNKCEAMN